MADVRGASGIPPVAAFATSNTPTPSTPLYIDTSTGTGYVLINGVVTQLNVAATTTGGVLPAQIFSAHAQTSVPFGNANDIIANRVFRSATPAGVWS